MVEVTRDHTRSDEITRDHASSHLLLLPGGGAQSGARLMGRLPALLSAHGRRARRVLPRVHVRGGRDRRARRQGSKRELARDHTRSHEIAAHDVKDGVSVTDVRRLLLRPPKPGWRTKYLEKGKKRLSREEENAPQCCRVSLTIADKSTSGAHKFKSGCESAQHPIFPSCMR